MNMAVDRVQHTGCDSLEVDLTLGADVFRLSPAAAAALGRGLIEASRP